MKRMYIVSYDICDDKRLRQVAHIMESYGDRIQYSVFRCELTRMDKVSLRGELSEVIVSSEDQVLFIDLGRSPGRGEDCIRSLGKKYIPQDSGSVVV